MSISVADPPLSFKTHNHTKKNPWKIANPISHHSLSPHAHTNMHLTSELISPRKHNEDTCYLSSTENIKITSSIQTNHLHDLTHFSTIWLYLYPSGKHIKHLFFSLYIYPGWQTVENGFSLIITKFWIFSILSIFSELILGNIIWLKNLNVQFFVL